MSQIDLTALSPIIVIAIVACVVLIAMAIRRNHLVAAGITLAGLVLSFQQLFQAATRAPQEIEPLLVIDQYALLFFGIMLIAAAMVTVLSYVYLRSRSEHREELYALILLAVLGSMVLAAADHFITLILGLETLTVALYVMIGYLRTMRRSLEAAIKYLVLAAAASAFLLLGMALIYFEVGTMSISELAVRATVIGDVSWFLLIGTVLILVGAGFKLGVVPFHMWTPDVYDGAPAPVTAFISTVSKAAMVAVLLRFLAVVDIGDHHAIAWIISAIAIASMIVGNFLALMQSNIKRLLAYSSIAHLGYVLVAVAVGGVDAIEGIIYYLLVYSLTLIGAFGTVSVLSPGEPETLEIDAYRGLFWMRPGVATVMAIMMFSLAGIPLTAGFIGKFLILSAGVGAMAWALSITLVITSAVGLYYYLRVIAAMLHRPEGETHLSTGPPVSTIGRTVLGLVGFAVVYFGVFPQRTLEFISTTVQRFISI